MANNIVSEELIKNIYNAFNPTQPLKANSPCYVKCSEVRGEENIFRELGKEILYSENATCQLYTGHRGVGKSTELLQLKHYLEEKGCFVVYFQADEEDIDPEDTQYTDILLTCTRYIVEKLNEYADSQPLLDWVKNRWQKLKDLGLTEISLDSSSLEVSLPSLGKLTANLRSSPSIRPKIREQVEAHTVSLIEELNNFINQARKQLPKNNSKLVVIADSLDRIARTKQENGETNHEEIFINRSNQLKSLECHMIYTIPISLVYSFAASEVQDNYGDPQILPMIMVKTPQGEVYQEGLEKLKEMVAKRVYQFASKEEYELEKDIFDSRDTLEKLCLMSGGHVRELMRFIQTAIQWIDELPISARAAQRAITKARNTYRLGVANEDWEKLAKASLTKQVLNEDEYRSLLFSRYLLEYRYVTEEEEIKRWHDAHPLLKNVEEFQEALAKVKQS